MAEATGKVVLALDTGTTSGRALIIDAGGVVLASDQKQAGLSTPQPGWVEQDAEELWQAQLATARGALQKAGLTAADVAGIGIANQRETTIIWDRATSQPVAPAIVWQDRRTADFCEQLRGAGAEAMVRRKTGLLLDPYFSGTKIRWLLDNVPGVRERAEAGTLAFGTVDCWLVWRLSGGRRHVTDATNASRTLLYDIREGRWDDELLDLFGVPRTLLPEVVDSSGVVGESDPELLGAAVPIAGMAGDQQAALFGQACSRRGMVKVTYGTGCFLLLNTGEEPVAAPAGLVTTVALQRDGKRTYALEGSVFIGGAAVQWLRDGLGIISSSSEADELAQACRRATAWSSCRPSPAWARRTGTPMRAAASSGSPAGRPRRTSPGRRWRASPSRSPTCTRRRPRAPKWRRPSCAPTAAPRRATCCCSSRPTCSACR